MGESVSFAGHVQGSADFGDGMFIGADFTDANLSNAVASRASFRGATFERTVVEGMTGQVMGPITVITEGGTLELDDEPLERWFRRHGAQVEIFRAE